MRIDSIAAGGMGAVARPPYYANRMRGVRRTGSSGERVQWTGRRSVPIATSQPSLSEPPPCSLLLLADLLVDEGLVDVGDHTTTSDGGLR